MLGAVVKAVIKSQMNKVKVSKHYYTYLNHCFLEIHQFQPRI